MGWSVAPWGSSWGTGVGGEPGVSPWDMLFGRQQGRILPEGVTAPDGDYVFCLGLDGETSTHLQELAIGDYFEVKQTADFDNETYISFPIQIRGSESDTLLKATNVLTLGSIPSNAETVVIGGKTYTFQTVLTNFDGNVLIGASAQASVANLLAAIVGTPAARGVTYATVTTTNTNITALLGAGDTLDATALVGGIAGNGIGTTETLSSGSWATPTLTGGATTGWKVSLLVNSVERASRTFGAGASIDTTLSANVSALAGDNEVALRLELT